jgi:NAD-dependent deacetylase
MLVAGSSLRIAPASDIPFIAHRKGARLIIVNYQATPLDRGATIVIHQDVAEVLPRLVEACTA